MQTPSETFTCTQKKIQQKSQKAPTIQHWYTHDVDDLNEGDVKRHDETLVQIADRSDQGVVTLLQEQTVY